MEKIYGYKQQDVIHLAKMLSLKKHKDLKQLFNEFSKESGKAVGTVRNLYYALVKHSQANKEFTKKYLQGISLSVTKITPFDKSSEKWLVDKVQEGVANGNSVRGIVTQLANGDKTLALRYQNKYRNLLVKNPDLARVVKQKLIKSKLETPITDRIPLTLLNRLKKEIDVLVNKIAAKEKKENDYLKKRIAFLESENLKLSRLIYGGAPESLAVDYFFR